MGALSPWHIILIAIVALFLFGPNKLPELGEVLAKCFVNSKMQRMEMAVIQLLMISLYLSVKRLILQRSQIPNQDK